MNARHRSFVLLAMSSLLGACAHQQTPRLAKYDLKSGYRFERIAGNPPPPQTPNSEDIFVVLAFSGGGTRAAALSLGVLNQLKATTFRLNTQTGQPCSAGEPGCEATPRSLLDEVDVISSVSGGSFTAAGYALYGQDIFKRDHPFQKNFLYYPLQRDLFAQAVFYPQNWTHLGARTEIAAKLYDGRVFDHATFKRLESRPRPYIILNGTDATTGARFEFNQDQFDLLCSDLSAVPLARGVTGSSAFPGLLNSMAVDSHNRKGEGCGYSGPGDGSLFDWTRLALLDRPNTPLTRYRTAQDLLAYRDPSRTTLHILDGGLADNIGLRAVIRSFESTDRAVQTDENGNETLGGWSLLSDLNKHKIKTLIVITANAGTKHDSNADTHVGGPSTIGVLGAASGIPMGNYSSDTLGLLQLKLQEYAAFASVKTFAFEVAFEDLPEDRSAADSERHFFQNLATSFELQPFEVDCLIDRGARLLRGALSPTQPSGPGDAPPGTSFERVVTDELKGEMGAPGGPHPAACTDRVAKKANGIRSHYIDIGVEYGGTFAQSGDIESHHAPGLALRITRPGGLSAIVDFGTQSFDVNGAIDGTRMRLGTVGLRTLSGGVAYTHRVSQLEATAGVAVGWGFGSFALSDAARDSFGRQGLFGLKSDATNALVLTPRVSLWQNLSDRWAVGVTASYIHATPIAHVASGDFARDQQIDASAIRVAAGLAFKVF